MRSKIGIGIAVLAILAMGIFLGLRSRHAGSPRVTQAATGAAPTPPTARGSAAPAASGQRQLVSDIIQKGVTVERATELFSLVLGPLPGVSVPAGGRDPSDFDGTFAVQEIYLVWDKLTLDQRRAAALLIDRPTATARTPAPSRSGSGAGPASAFHVALAVDLRSADPTPAYDYDNLGVGANTELSGLLHLPPINFKVDIEYGTPTGTEYAHTMSWWTLFDNPRVPIFSEKKAYSDGSCHITVWNQKFQALNATDAQSILVHEMFHCYQQRDAGTFAVLASVRSWIAEGEATWAMGAVVPGTHAILDEHWNSYVFGPLTLYKDRSYDAVGVYGHMSDLLTNSALWPKLMPVFEAGEGDQNIAAFNLLIQGHEEEFYSSWGSSYFVVSGHTPWTMSGPADAPTSGPGPTDVTINDSSNVGLTPADPDTARIFSVSGGADIALVALYTGYARVHDSGFDIDAELTSSAPLALCLKSGGCTCPDGTPGASLFTKQATAPLAIGLEGGDTTGQVGIMGQSLDKFCKQPEQPSPPSPDGGGGGTGGGGGGNGGGRPPDTPQPPAGEIRGDTHIVTFDGLHYDFQVVGEYTLVKSTKDDFLVQVRQVPMLKSRTASITQAVATRLNGHRVTVTVENGAFTARVDGTEVFGTPPASVRGAMTCPYTMMGYSCRLTWPDGTTLVVSQGAKYALDVEVRPAAPRMGQLAGLLGDGDHSTANDLVGSNSAPLGVNPTAADITHSLADAWRIAADASLFDYQAGQTSQTFVDPTFPGDNVTAANAPDRDAAEKACRQQGITQKDLLDDCILDLAVTKDSAFSLAYGHAQRVASARATLTAVAMPGILKTLVLQGTITDKNTQPSLTFEVARDDVLWIDPEDCQDANGVIHMHVLSSLDLSPPGWREDSHSGLARVPWDAIPCKVGRFVMLATGQSEILLNPLKNATGDYRILLRYIRHDRVGAVKYGDVISGHVENPAAIDRYTFTGHAGDVVRVSGKDCEMGRMSVTVDAEQVSCRPGDDTHLRVDGEHYLVINWNGASGPGDYHFVLQGAATK